MGELRLIGDALTSGTGGIVLAGAPGVGKTRLAREAVARSDPRRYVRLWTAGTAAARSVPLGAFAPWLPGDLHAGPATRLRDATRALLERCGPRRLLLGVDDAHLLDDSSATLVHQFARTRKAFVLVCLRTRHDVPDPIRALWKDQPALWVEIRAPDPAGAAEVLVAALGAQLDRITSRRLCQAAQGNLSFLRELVEAGLGSGALTESAGVWCWNGPWVITPRLAELVSAQIGHREPAEDEVLELVAYGEPIGADLLTSLADRRTVEALESRKLLLARQDGRRVDVRLAHPLYGEMLRAACPPQRAAAVRAVLADAVAATGARRRDDWLRIVTWRLDAHLPLRPDLLVAAAGRALDTLDLPLAERLATTAIRLGAAAGPGAAARPGGDQVPPDRTSDRSAADVVLGRVLFVSHRHAETEQLLARPADTPMPADRRLSRAVLRICNLFCGLQQVGEAFAVLRATRDAVDDPALRDELDLLECVLHLLAADLPGTLDGLVELPARPQPSSPTAAGPGVVHAMVLVHLGLLVQARTVLDRLDVPEQPCGPGGMPWIGQLHTMYRCHTDLFAGRLAAAGEFAAACQARATQTEWDLALQLAATLQAQVARMRGRVRTAARCAREGLRRHRPGAPWANQLRGELAHARALAGQPASAAAALGEADHRPAPAEAFTQPWIDLARPWVAAAAGNRAGAVELARAAAAQTRDRAAACFEAIALHDLVRLGAPAPAVPRLEELAGRVDSELVRAFAAHAVAAAGADPGGLEAAGGALVGLGADLLAAEAYAQAADEYRRRDAAARDRRLRAQAALLLDGCEGARTPLVAAVAAPQLTAREREIARLAAGGLSNQEIADRMVISSRTVGNHLYHVYAKLGISGRSALAAAVQPLRGP